MTRRSKRTILGCILGLVLVIGLAVHFYLDVYLLKYVNRTLNNIDGYEGSVESISVHLYRGAYEIHDLKIYKKNGHIPTPFVDIAQVDLSLQWSALLHGRIVSNIDLDQPMLNFAVGKSGAKQTGKEVDWNKPIRDLMPIDINHVTFKNGKLSYQDFSTSPQVNVYIHHMHGEVTNLRNVVDKTKALPSTLDVEGDSIGHGSLVLKGNMNALKPVPDMDLEAKLENADLTAFNDYADAYGAINIKRGRISVYSEFVIKNGHVTGYVKPIATDVSLIDLRKPTNPVKLAWESVVAIIVEIFTNHEKDQFATKVPLEGNLGNISTDTWSAVAGIIENAFVSAFKKGIDGSLKYE